MDVVKYAAVAIALFLLLALLLGLVISSCADNGGGNTDATTTESTTTEATTETTETTVPKVPCTGVTLSASSHTFSAAGQTFRVTATCTPADTTEAAVFASSDPTVATVSQDGIITAMNGGTAIITVTCGSFKAECEIGCYFENGISPDTLLLNRKELPLSFAGATWKLYDGAIDVSLITFSSDNESVVTFVDGVVTAVGSGTVQVHAEYNGQKVSCTVICDFSGGSSTGGNGGVTEDGGNNNSDNYTLNYKDVSLYVSNEPYSASFYLKLLDSMNNPVEIVWGAEKEGIVTISGNKITAIASGTVTVSATYEGITYSCTVRCYP